MPYIIERINSFKELLKSVTVHLYKLFAAELYMEIHLFLNKI